MDSRALVAKVALRDCGFKGSGCKGGFERLWIQGLVAKVALRDCGFRGSGCKGGFERLWIQGLWLQRWL